MAHILDRQEIGNKNFGFANLPVELFATGSGFYIFDSRNVCFFEVEKIAYDIIGLLRDQALSIDALKLELPQYDPDDIERSFAELMELQDKRFLAPYDFKRIERHENTAYQEVLSSQMCGLTIFITTQCNLGCSYCIYGGQYKQHNKLSQVPMQWDVLKSSLDFLKERSHKSPKVQLDFFGGEPLMAFPLIKRGVEYFKSIINDDKEINITITSNGTIINDAILEFIVEKNVYLQFSIDGGEEAHDSKRRFIKTDKPSYNIIMSNLEKIYNRSEEYFDKYIRLKSVITMESLKLDDYTFYENNYIRRIIKSGHLTFLNLEPHFELEKDDDYFSAIEYIYELISQIRDAKTENDLINDLNVKQKELYRKTLGLFFENQAVNQVYFGENEEVPFTKGCMTGFKEGAVNAAGDISICLKSSKGDNFVIGNTVDNEWYFDKIRSLNSKFHHEWTGCSSCFVQRTCDLCYEKLDGDSENWVSGRSKFCEFNREKHRTIYAKMLAILEKNPLLWDYVDDLVRKKRSQLDDGTSGNREMYESSQLEAR